MSISNFFNSPAGMYVAQAFSHSLVAALVVDRAIQAWGIGNPVIRQRFSLIVILFPILSFPFYQIIDPERGSTSFRLDTLFDINRWLNLEIWGVIPVNILFLIMLLITTLVFLFQEMIPVIRHTIESRGVAAEEEEDADHPAVRNALQNFPGEKPRVAVLDDDEFILFSTTGRNPTVFLSSGLLEKLDTRELRAAIAHEVAHIARNKRPLLVAVFFMRMLMFFNPVVLVEFRRMVQEEEKICDDIAVSMTHEPGALAEVLRKFNHGREEPDLDRVREISKLGAALEDYSHNVHLESRISRLVDGTAYGTSGQWIRFILTLAVVGVINYFVV
jgi:hypothetical protein